MATVVGGGPPVNDGERLVIRHLRDNTPDHWLLLHNIEIPVHSGAYEVDVLMVTDHSVCVIDAKGTHGRIAVAGSQWLPRRGAPFYSPVRKIRGHARALQGVLAKARPQLASVYVDQLVVLVAPGAQLIDGNDRSDADALDVVDLAGLIPALKDVSRVRPRKTRDLTSLRRLILEALHAGVRNPSGPKQFGNWLVTETLNDHEFSDNGDDVAEYRATNASAPSSETVRLRVYRADPFLSQPERDAQRSAIANAYEVLTRMPPNPYVVGRRDFFPIEDESRYVLVLDDVPGQALTVHLSDPRQALGADARIRVVTDLLRGLSHAHANQVVHRALNPSAVLVTGAEGKSLLTGFDYARPEGPRDQSVLTQLSQALDPAYVAPECQDRAQAMTQASDVYAAGVIAFRLLIGELPFANTAEQISKGSELPSPLLDSADLGSGLAALLRRMCTLKPSARPSASQALAELAHATRRSPATPSNVTSRPDYRNLPENYQLTRKLTVRRRLGGGGGSFGTAYQVYDSLAGEDRVAKIVHTDRQSVVERLQLEYNTLRQLPPHRSIVRLEEADYLDGGDIPYLLLEYVPGREVSELVDDRVLGPADVVQLGIDVAEGLAFLHENGVYHCDIKPNNLLLSDTGCKIFDFNVSVTGNSIPRFSGGPSRYRPPDFGTYGEITGAELADRDVYALGFTLYQLLTGQRPFAQEAPTTTTPIVNPRTFTGLGDLSDELVTALTRSVAGLRTDRYPSAAEFLTALRSIGDCVHQPRHPAPPLSLAALRPSGRPDENPFVDYLQTLFSQSTDSNAGTRSGVVAPPYDLYVHTRLDERLTKDVLRGAFRLVIITGNAGDGKTAFLERLLKIAAEDSAIQPVRSGNGAAFQTLGGLRLLTNSDGSQDVGENDNDYVLAEFFGPFTGKSPTGDSGEVRLIAINEGRLVDFLSSHERAFPALNRHVQASLRESEEQPAQSDILVVNLNRRSLLSELDEANDPVFDRLLLRMTHENHWAACETCPLAATCYARHNALSVQDPSAGPKIRTRLRRLFQLTELRGLQHLTMRDIQSALAFMLTSGRTCSAIHSLYASDEAPRILDGFYFNSWNGAGRTNDRLLTLLSEVDVAANPEPGLDRRLVLVGPDGKRALMTLDQRGDYDSVLLKASFEGLSGENRTSPAEAEQYWRYLDSARRRFYFECVDDDLAQRMLPYRSATDYLTLLQHPERLEQNLDSLLLAMNRSEGMADPEALGPVLALEARHIPDALIHGFRLFPADDLSLHTPQSESAYLETSPQELVLRHSAPGARQTTLRIRLDLFELLARLRDGYLPGSAEQQGRHLDLTIFKHELASIPYQEVLLTVTGDDRHRIVRRPEDGVLVMEHLDPRDGPIDQVEPGVE